MANAKPGYAVPSIVSFSESEIMDRMGTATQYEGLDAVPGADPAASGHGGKHHGKGRGRGKAGKD
jgi:hypothetical protein